MLRNIAIVTIMLLAGLLNAAALQAAHPHTIFPLPFSPQPPLDGDLALSANFAELRPNHFHGGLDFKTGGRTGLPVYAVEQGYIERVTVSPSGYGKAIYVAHPFTGHTTVYAHLSAFTPEVTALVEAERGRLESPTDPIDLRFLPFQFPVEKGQQIALSGNTGHSFGPHLHFEIRERLTLRSIDPLPFFIDAISDTTPPRVHSVKAFPVADRPDYVYLAIAANDYLDNSSNIFGILSISLYVEGRLHWQRTLSQFHTPSTRIINSLLATNGPDDRPPFDTHTRLFQWTRIPSLSAEAPTTAEEYLQTRAHLLMPTLTLQPIDIYAATPDGSIYLPAGTTLTCLYILTDAHGNTTSYPFLLSRPL